MLFVILLGTPLGLAVPVQDPPRFRAQAYAALFEIRVTDRAGSIVRNLAQSDFIVREDGRDRRISHFQEQESAPVRLAILIDTGSSMSSEEISTGRQMVFSLIHELDPDDQILLASYDNDVHFLTELTSDRKELVNALWNIGLGGRPGKLAKLAHLFASSGLTGYAVDLALRELGKTDSANKILLVVSSGFGNIGKATGDHVEMAGARLVAVSMENKMGDAFNLGGDQTARKRIVQRSGGVSFSGREVLERIEQVRDFIKHHYLIAYEPGEGDKELLERKVEFRIPSCPECEIHAGRRSQSSDSIYR